MTDPGLELYCACATVILDAACWVLDRYIAALEWIGARLERWRLCHIIRVGPLRVKFHRDYIYFYTLHGPTWLWVFRKRGRRG